MADHKNNPAAWRASVPGLDDFDFTLGTDLQPTPVAAVAAPVETIDPALLINDPVATPSQVGQVDSTPLLDFTDDGPFDFNAFDAGNENKEDMFDLSFDVPTPPTADAATPADLTKAVQPSITDDASSLQDVPALAPTQPTSTNVGQGNVAAVSWWNNFEVAMPPLLMPDFTTLRRAFAPATGFANTAPQQHFGQYGNMPYQGTFPPANSPLLPQFNGQFGGMSNSGTVASVQPAQQTPPARTWHRANTHLPSFRDKNSTVPPRSNRDYWAKVQETGVGSKLKMTPDDYDEWRKNQKNKSQIRRRAEKRAARQDQKRRDEEERRRRDGTL